MDKNQRGLNLPALSEEEQIQAALNNDDLTALSGNEVIDPTAYLSDTELAEIQFSQLNAGFDRLGLSLPEPTSMPQEPVNMPQEPASVESDGFFVGAGKALYNIPFAIGQGAVNTYGMSRKNQSEKDALTLELFDAIKDGNIKQKVAASIVAWQKNNLGELGLNALRWAAGIRPDAVKGEGEQAANDAFELADDIAAKKKEIQYSDSFLGDVGRVAAEGVPSLLVGLLSAYATKNPVLGSTVAASVFSGDSYREGIKAGLDHETAKERALAMSTVDAAFGAIGLEGITMPAKTNQAWCQSTKRK